MALHRVAYDVRAAVAAFEHGLRAAGPDFVELIVRELRTGHPYLGPALRATADLGAAAVPAAIRRFLATHPCHPPARRGGAPPSSRHSGPSTSLPAPGGATSQ